MLLFQFLVEQQMSSKKKILISAAQFYLCFWYANSDSRRIHVLYLGNGSSIYI